MNTNIKLTIVNNNLALCFPPSNFYYLIDNEQIVKIFNHNTKWYLDDNSTYPYYINTYNKLNKVNLIDFIFGTNNNITFKNKNSDYCDIRQNNVNIEIKKHKYNDIICKKYNVIEYIQGHYKQDTIINPYWKIQDDSTYYLMYCDKNILVKLTEEQYIELENFKLSLDYQLSWIYAFMRTPLIISCNNKTQLKLHHILKSFNYKSLIKLDCITYKNTHTNLLEYDTIIKNKYNVTTIIQGHMKSIGQDAGKEKNRLWEIEDFDKLSTYLLMYCEPDTYVKLCKESYNKILNFEKNINNNNKITWFKMENGYIAGTLVSTKQLYIHQVIMDCYGNGKGTKNISIDHIDQDPCNNMSINLRIATREQQENNSKGIKKDTKRARKHNAKALPEGLTQEMMPKYIVYYNECYNKEKKLYREFFKIETHPKLEKIWISSKSNKLTIFEKLDAAKNVLNSI